MQQITVNADITSEIKRPRLIELVGSQGPSRNLKVGHNSPATETTQTVQQWAQPERSWQSGAAGLSRDIIVVISSGEPNLLYLWCFKWLRPCSLRYFDQVLRPLSSVLKTGAVSVSVQRMWVLEELSSVISNRSCCKIHCHNYVYAIGWLRYTFRWVFVDTALEHLWVTSSIEICYVNYFQSCELFSFLIILLRHYTAFGKCFGER